VFFGSYAPEGVSPVWYSLVFNATYLVPEMLICCLILKVLPVKKMAERMAMAHN
jgi:thiamine transporter